MRAAEAALFPVLTACRPLIRASVSCSLERVKEELSFFLNARVPQVKFVDRTFNCKKSHAMAIWQFIRENDNGITNFHFEIAADLLDQEELDLLSSMRPGLIQLEIGVQSHQSGHAFGNPQKNGYRRNKKDYPSYQQPAQHPPASGSDRRPSP